MSYLCIDVEWNVPASKDAEKELLSIGAVCWDSRRNKTKTFFKLIKPQRMELVTPESYQRLMLSSTVLTQARSCETVLTNFAITFSTSVLDKDDPIVLWSADDWCILRDCLCRYGICLPSKHVVILQDVLSFYARAKQKSFVLALEQYKINYRQELLHNAKYDAQYLIDLYDAVYNAIGKSPKRLVHTMSSTILHYPDCLYIRRRQNFAGDWADALSGWRICKCCGKSKQSEPQTMVKAATQPNCIVAIPVPPRKKKKVKKPKKSKVSWPVTEEQIDNYCKKRGISCQFSVGWLFLRTPASFWRVQYDDSNVKQVLHQSWRIDKRDIGKKQRLNAGFHQQNVKYKDIFATINYIYEHDKHFLNPDFLPSYWGANES